MIVAALYVAVASSAQAQNMLYWNTTGSAAWSGTANWTSGTFYGSYYNGGSVINNGGTATITAADNVTDGTGNGTIFIGGSSASIGGNGGNGYVTMSGGVLNSNNSPLQEVLGVAAGSGIFTQSGGVNNSMFATNNYPGDFSSLQLGSSPGGYGEYDLQGGALDACAIFVGANNGLGVSNPSGLIDAGTGVFTQVGGSVGSFGSSGSNNAVGLMVGGNWSGGRSRTPLSCSAVGTYTLGNANGTGRHCSSAASRASALPAPVLSPRIAGPTPSLAEGLAPGLSAVPPVAYNSSAGALLLGWYSGTQRPGAGAYAGNGVGTYNLNGGLLTGDASGNNGLELVGGAGTGIFSQTGGTNNASYALCVGGGGNFGLGILPQSVNPAYGTYSLSQGLLTTPMLSVGAAGTGIFTQTGGTNIVNYELLLGGAARRFATGSSGSSIVSTPGTYNLNGGLLQTGYIGVNFSAIGTVGPATFNFTAGTLQAPAGGLSNSLPITVGTAASNIATLDPHGQTMLINYNGYPGSGCLTGPGQLVVNDSVSGGTVVLGNTDYSQGPIFNTYTGGTKVLSGTLQLLYGLALPATGDLSVGSPGAQATVELDSLGFASVQGLITSNAANFKFQTAGLDFLVIGSDGMNLAANTTVSFGANPTMAGDYPLFYGDPTMIDGVDLGNLVLPTAPAGWSYSLSKVAGPLEFGFGEGEYIDLVATAVPEPGTLALLARRARSAHACLAAAQGRLTSARKNTGAVSSFVRR